MGEGQLRGQQEQPRQVFPSLKLVRALDAPLQDALGEDLIAKGYSIRMMYPGEESAWTSVLNSAGDLGNWNVDKAFESFVGRDRVWREAIFLVWHGEEPCGTACVMLHDGWPDNPELGWVAVKPGHRGMGLGKVVCSRVMEFMREKGWKKCYLLTDDFRIPAIKTYLALGFAPVYEHESHQGRWQALEGKLGRPV